MTEETKRRGRPPKVAAIEQAPLVQPATEVLDEFARRQALAYARRVWDGQSPDVKRAERLRRVQAALEAQGMSMEGIEL